MSRDLGVDEIQTASLKGEPIGFTEDDRLKATLRMQISATEEESAALRECTNLLSEIVAKNEAISRATREMTRVYRAMSAASA